MNRETCYNAAMPRLEIAVTSLDDALQAQQGGADSIEISEDLSVGGLTPTFDLVRQIREAMTIQDWAAQRCTISYRAPELFNVESHCIIDERTDIWVQCLIT